MTFWLLNQLFESSTAKEERERRAERKYQEKIKRARIEGKKRALEMDKLRDAAGCYGANRKQALNGQEDPYLPYSYKKDLPSGEFSPSPEDAMSRGLGGAPEVASGYKHGQQRLPPPGQYVRQESRQVIDSSVQQALSKMKRPF